MPRTHLTSSGEVPSASAGISPPPFAWGSSSSRDLRLSVVALRAVASSSGHRFIAARDKRGGIAGGREAGDTRRPGPPVVPQVISAPARTHVDKSSSPVRARGAPGQPAGRSVPAASIPLRLPRLGLPSVWRPPRCGSGGEGGRAGERARERVYQGSEEGAAGKEVAPAGAPRLSCALPPLDRWLPGPEGDPTTQEQLLNAPLMLWRVWCCCLNVSLPNLAHRALSKNL